MDTDDLSKEAYQGVLAEAEYFNPDLTLQFGLISESCENEEEYLRRAKELINEIRNLRPDELSEMFFGKLPNKMKMDKTLDQILINIIKVEKIPIEKRFFET